MTNQKLYDTQTLWDVAWQESLGEIDLTDARVGGRATKLNPDKENVDFWQTAGPKWLESYIQWRDNNPNWKIWTTPEGEPAIELGLVVDIAGVNVKMVIDRVFEVDGELVVVDLKTSQRYPSNPLQLGFYKVGLEKQFGVPVKWGNYYMARTFSTGNTIDLSEFTHDKLEYIVDIFDKSRKAGLFLPNTNNCNVLCGLTEYCEFYPGKIG